MIGKIIAAAILGRAFTLAAFMVVLDTSIANVELSHIAGV